MQIRRFIQYFRSVLSERSYLDEEQPRSQGLSTEDDNAESILESLYFIINVWKKYHIFKLRSLCLIEYSKGKIPLGNLFYNVL